ncbi:hypothetical protein P7K49_039797 [Saguinus oedipus]|uniref:Uncharacterized protein n=1 Tax=Saguinus oedipus TaxID=9490 RepID=A0ABQ9TC75_SAGOE|nr:hypothetical protein P7K49_039797 [Saguinus oedipus]
MFACGPECVPVHLCACASVHTCACVHVCPRVSLHRCTDEPVDLCMSLCPCARVVRTHGGVCPRGFWKRAMGPGASDPSAQQEIPRGVSESTLFQEQKPHRGLALQGVGHRSSGVCVTGSGPVHLARPQGFCGQRGEALCCGWQDGISL